MLKKTLALIGLTISISANATSVSYNGYTLDTDTNIVTGGGLQWLQWDMTIDESINSALATYGGSGWRVASNAEMASLFNSFDFELVFDADENTRQAVDFSQGNALYSFGEANRFIELFGDTTEPGSVLGIGDTYEVAAAWYGEDSDADDRYNYAYVSDEYQQEIGVITTGGAIMAADLTPPSGHQDSTGVALVRVGEVPIPAAAWLFGSALLGLGALKRKGEKDV